VSAAARLTGKESEAVSESPRGNAVSQELSWGGWTLQTAALGLTAGGSGRLSSVAATTNATRIQIVHEAVFICSSAPSLW
jgi:hypothetical protein